MIVKFSSDHFVLRNAKVKFLWDHLLLGTWYLTSKNVRQKVLSKKRPSCAFISSEKTVEDVIL